MIYSIRGNLINIYENFLIVEVNGIGYKCLTDNFTLSKLSSCLNSEIKLYTYMNVREDTIFLFAFLDHIRLKCFKNLLSVSGVGSKVALALLSEFSPEQLFSLIASNDSKSLTKAHGLGKKLAQRIILELRDKVSSEVNDIDTIDAGIVSASKNICEASNALSVLGYSNKEIMPILSKLDNSLSVETLIKEVLKHMG